MVVGFNHNFRYKGEIYHIQTEDSGLKSPNIVTLLYHGGTILASKKTSYADITKIDNLDYVVEELMKEQHKEMLRSLKAGEFDEVIGRFQSNRAASPRTLKKLDGSQSSSEQKSISLEVSSLPIVELPVSQISAKKPDATATPKTSPVVESTGDPTTTSYEPSLDEVILSYLMGDDK